MAIPQARIDAATDAYIKSGFVSTEAYKAAHPSIDRLSASKVANQFMVNFGIKEKALAILNSNKKLQLPNIISGFTEHLEAANGVYFKGQRIGEEPAHSIRLEARKFIAEKLYGLGQSDINIDNRSVNVSLETSDTRKLDDIIQKLGELRSFAAADIKARAEAAPE